ncbi:hypothetical protein AB0B94_30535 [Micromonospora sp. NPDC048986]|uniref:hypothetical protein n=1 Tax=Micromonospora sp. NPDC048986 TaxID=3155644 RepID=UPI0033F4FA36
MRNFVRVSIDLPTHPKLTAIDDPAAGWAYVTSMCHSGGSYTDGHFHVNTVLRIANVDKAVAIALAEQGLWHMPGHDCDRCDQPKQGQAVIHDYLQHNRSAASVQELADKRRNAGKKGASARWGKDKNEPSAKKPQVPGQRKPKQDPAEMANAMASAMANGQQNLWQTDGKPMAEERRGEENLQTPSVSAATASPPTAPSSEPRTETQRSKVITDAYYEVEPMSNWNAVNGVVRKAIRSNKFTDDEIRDAVLRLAKEGRGVSVETLRIELVGLTPRSTHMNGAGYRAQKVNHDEPGAHKASWDRRRQHAQQQQ